jgi:hypothetical protein
MGHQAMSRLSSSFAIHFLQLPLFISDTLVKMGYTAVQSDGEELDILWNENGNFREELSTRCGERLPRPANEEAAMLTILFISEILSTTISRARSSRQSSTYTVQELHIVTSHREIFRMYFNTIAEIPVDLTKWRHWKSGHVRSLEPTTQRKVETELADRWRERILSHFIPHAASISQMKEVMGMPVPYQEYKDLFGKTRFGTFRGHCLKLEKVLQLEGFAIPWGEKDVRLVLNSHRDLEHTPAKVQSTWNTLKWFSKKLGLLNIGTLSALKEKKDAISMTLTPLVRKPQKKAKLPDHDLLVMLEHGAMGLIPGTTGLMDTVRNLAPMDPVICAIARFDLGAGGRFNDFQHAGPSSYTKTAKTRELDPWQSKTVDANSVQNQPVPLISPLYSFSGHHWWTALDKYVSLMISNPVFKSMDYFLPTINQDRSGFIPRPCGYDRSLRWLRDVLVRLGAEPEVASTLTWHSLRLWMADCAFQARIPLADRKWLGNWLKETTADVYTREKRNVV